MASRQWVMMRMRLASPSWCRGTEVGDIVESSCFRNKGRCNVCSETFVDIVIIVVIVIIIIVVIIIIIIIFINIIIIIFFFFFSFFSFYGDIGLLGASFYTASRFMGIPA